MFLGHITFKHITAAVLAIVLGSGACMVAAASSTHNDPERSFLFFGKKKKKGQASAAPAESAKTDYETLTDSAVTSQGMFNVIRKNKDYYFEIPLSLMDRDMLVVNKLVRVPEELNQAGVNRGINSSNIMIRFGFDPDEKKVFASQSRVVPDVDPNDAIARSVKDNYIFPFIAAFKTEAYNADSTAVVVKVTDLFDGKNDCFGNIFNDINLGTPVSSELSKIKSVKAFKDNVFAVSELTTRVVEPGGAVSVTVEVGTSIVLLPEKPMQRRLVSPRVGYFHESTLGYSDNQQRVHRRNYITRWRLEPKPEEEQAYLAGILVEPAKPITFHIDNSTPRQWRPYIRKGIEDWNSAFELAGFKNAIRVEQIPDSTDIDMDDINYSTITYAASTKSNAMGPSITDPRSGEIIEADVMWWHNVLDILHDWIVVQTAAANPDARSLVLPDSLIGDAMRFVACHEVGHSLGLRHNMMASAGVPTDSLRSPSYVEWLGGTSSSIMDYARFNYVAQPGDGVKVLSPHIGPYDRMAIQYGYRWYGKDTPEEDYRECNNTIAPYTGDLYRYSEAQDSRDAVDPRALSEDLGDDAVKAATYGIANLKRIVPNIVKWTTSGEQGQDYDDASNLLSSIIGQWQRYIYHTMANVGGIYVDNTTVGDGNQTYTHVERERQKAATEFILKNVFDDTDWLFDSDVTRYTYLVLNSPIGRIENAPVYLLNNARSYVLWDLLSDNRIMRMYENVDANGKQAFAPSELIDMMHKQIFGPTVAGKTLTKDQRSIQKNYVDALMIAANENMGLKDAKRTLTSDDHNHAHADYPGDKDALALLTLETPLQCYECMAAGERTAGHRQLNFYGSHANRISDAISLKRGELLRILRLLKSRIPSASRDTRSHYEDLVMRINSSLGLRQDFN